MTPLHRDESLTSNPIDSHGPIRNDELVIRILFHPIDVGDAGELLETAIPLKDLRFRGLSIFRREFSTIEELLAVQGDRSARNAALGKKVEPRGVAAFSADQAREIEVDKAVRAFVVIDQPIEQISCGHGYIASATPISEGKSRHLRKVLLPLLARTQTTLTAAYSETYDSRSNLAARAAGKKLRDG